MLNVVILQLTGIHHRHLEPFSFLLEIIFGVDGFVRCLCLIDLRLPRISELRVCVDENETCKCVLFRDPVIC